MAQRARRSEGVRTGWARALTTSFVMRRRVAAVRKAPPPSGEAYHRPERVRTSPMPASSDVKCESHVQLSTGRP